MSPRQDPSELWAEFERRQERDQAELQELKALAREVFASMDGLSPSTLRTLALGLSFMRESGLDKFSNAISYYADKVEDPDVIDGFLAELSMAGNLRMVARFHPDLDGLLERLREQERQPWPTLAGALEQAREAVA